MQSNVVLLQREEKVNVKWGRALLHFSLYLTFALIYQYGGLGKQAALSVFIIFAIPTVFLDVLRFYSPWWCAFVNNNLHAWNIIKESEMNKLSGLSEGVIGMMIVMVLCPKDTAIVAALCVGSIDPAARIIGMKFGKEKFSNGKSLVGMLGGAVAVFITASLFYTIPNLAFPPLMFEAMAFAVMCEAAVESKDNIAIPIGVALTMNFTNMLEWVIT